MDIRELAKTNAIVAEALETLDKHGYVFGKSSTAEITDPAKVRAIKAACRTIVAADIGARGQIEARAQAQSKPARPRRQVVPHDCGNIDARLNKALRLLEDGLELHELPAAVVNDARVALERDYPPMSPALKAVARRALALAEAAVEPGA